MSPNQPIVFLSYSHKDEALKERLETHLKAMRGRLDVWDDRRLKAGEDWHKGITQALDSAHAAVLLISADFLASDFIQTEEVPRLLKRREKEGVAIIPVLISSCPWQEIPWLAAMQIRPADARPVAAFEGNDREQAYADIAREVLELANEQQKLAVAAPRPSYVDAPSQEPAEALEAAYAQHKECMSTGGDPTATLETIQSLKRRLRKECQLKPGDQLADGREDGYGTWASFKVNGVVQRMRWISPGTFTMGSPETELGRWGDEGPAHRVTLTRGYWLANTPCTQALWQTVMDDNPSEFEGPQRPVERVSWQDCQQFLEKVNLLTPGLDLRLPTEAEWEYACRAGWPTARWDSDLDDERELSVLGPIAWYSGTSGRETQKVARKPPNPWGLFDMLGNVNEWCLDGRRRYSKGAVVDPVGPMDDSRRVIRGGSWLSNARRVRAAYRNSHEPSNRSSNLGFRLALGPLHRAP